MIHPTTFITKELNHHREKDKASTENTYLQQLAHNIMTSRQILLHEMYNSTIYFGYK